MDLFSLKGKTIVVTGGAGYLGRAMCEGFAQYGASVAVASRDEIACRALSEELCVKYSVRAQGIGVDILDTDSVRHLFASAAGRFGAIDVLVNSAFVPIQGFVPQLDDALWQEGIEGAVGVVFRCIREALPYMRRQKHGKIINIASMYGMIAPDPATYGGNAKLNNPACYGVGKAALIQLTKYIASYYGKDGIAANCISPGAFPHAAIQQNEGFIEKLSAKTMLGRVGYPDELKGIAVFLASDASSYITGQNICVDGGVTAW
jgi:gluconate 5-dehydrogenase